MSSSFDPELREKILAILPPDRVHFDLPHRDAVSWDALSESRLHPLKSPSTAIPFCAVEPSSTGEVKSLVGFANTEEIPIIPYGGGSGLMGGALSTRPNILIDLRRLNHVLDIDAEGRMARVQAGIVLEALDQRLDSVGYMLGHDPWTVPVATVGGAISTNSVGYRAGLYGSMGEQVLGLEAVLPNGEILRTRAIPKSSVGPNLNFLLIGGEGCFGIITEATIRIFPKPSVRALYGVRFDSFEVGFLAIQEMTQARLRPALVDFGDDEAEPEGGAILYLAFEGNPEIVAAEARLALEICDRAGGRQLPEGAAQEFWNNRHSIARSFMNNRRLRRERGRDGRYRDWIHVALPGSKVLPFRAAAKKVIASRSVELQESGLWVQPELFSMRLAADEGSVASPQLALEETIEELLRLVQKFGGSMEYTHGVGVKLAPLMAEEHGYGLDVLRRIKRLLDPNNIMNPGKLAL
ncbi:MAG TPA: FAD-binding oxidoreductase [Candidatus Binatia bacterium]